MKIAKAFFFAVDCMNHIQAIIFHKHFSEVKLQRNTYTQMVSIC